MDNLTIFANKAEYEKNRINLEYPNVSLIEEDLNTITRKRYSTGHVDVDGLKAIGWPDDDIKYFDYKGVNWDEAQDAQYIVPQTDKNLMPMDKSKIAGAKTTMKYCPYFDTSKVTDMTNMFNGCSSLTSIPKFNTSKVIDMDNMFYNCTSLKSVPQFDTSKVTDMNWMFGNCQILVTVPQFDTNKVTNMNWMFSGCSGLTTVPLFDTRNVTDMNEMFCNCSSLKSVPQFDTSKVIDMDNMFWGCSGLTTVPLFDTRNVIYMSGIFHGCSNLTALGGFIGLKCNIELCYSEKLTKQSLLNVINDAASGVSGVTMLLGPNLNKLTEEEKAIATKKGWKLA